MNCCIGALDVEVKRYLYHCMKIRYFVVALRSYEWDEAYVSMYNQLKPGGYFQVLEPSILVSDGVLFKAKMKETCINQQVTRMGCVPR